MNCENTSPHSLHFYYFCFFIWGLIIQALIITCGKMGLYREHGTYFKDVQCNIVLLTLLYHPHALCIYYLRGDENLRSLSHSTLFIYYTE